MVAKICKVSCVQRRIKQPSGVRGEGGGAGERLCAKLYHFKQVCAKLYQLEQLCAKLYQLEQGDKGETAGRYLRRVRSLFRPSRSPQTTPASAQTDENYRRTSSACRPPGKRGLVACCCSITSIIKIHPLQKNKLWSCPRHGAFELCVANFRAVVLYSKFLNKFLNF